MSPPSEAFLGATIRGTAAPRPPRDCPMSFSALTTELISLSLLTLPEREAFSYLNKQRCPSTYRVSSP